MVRYACRLAGDGLSKSIRGQKVDNAQLLALWSLVLAWESDFVREVTQKEELLVQSQQLLDRVTQTGSDTRVEQAFIFLQKTNATQNTDLDKTKRSANLGLTLLRELNDRWGEAEALLFLGGYYADRGALYLANDLLRSSLAIKQQLNDTQGIATTTHFLGTVARYQGNFEEAETLHQQSLSLYQQLGKLSSVRMCLGILSLTLSWAGKFLAAKDIVEQAIEIGQDLGQLPNPRLFNPLTKATIHLGHYEEGLVMATENLELARQIGWLSHIGFGLTFLGEAAFVEGDLDGAMHHLLEGSAVFAELQHVHLAFPQAILSYVIRAQGDEKMTREQLASAVQLGTIDHSIFAIIYSLPVAALLAADNDDPERAVELYGLAQQFRHISNSRWFEDVACRELDKVRASCRRMWRRLPKTGGASWMCGKRPKPCCANWTAVKLGPGHMKVDTYRVSPRSALEIIKNQGLTSRR